MKRSVLIVDDDTELCSSLEETLSENGTLDLVSAPDGHKAMELLMERSFDLLITDLQMPRMDGFALLAYVTRHCPDLACLVITAHDTDEISELYKRVGEAAFLRKPFKTDAIKTKIYDILSSHEKGMISGISMGPFLQLLEMERKTCTLTVSHEDEEGSIYIAYGALFDAETGDERGEKAAMEIIGWDSDVKIRIEDICRSSERTIQRDLRFLIMESLRRTDELAAGQEISDEIDLGALEDLDFKETESDQWEPKVLDTLPDDKKEQLEGYLTGLRDIKGVLGSAVVNTKGSILVKSILSPKLNIDAVCETYGEYVPSPFSTPEEQVHETVFRSQDQVVVVQSAGKHSRFGFHLVVVIAQESAEGLLKIRLRRLMPKLMAKLYAADSIAPSGAGSVAPSRVD